jgi:hypothetical protein
MDRADEVGMPYGPWAFLFNNANCFSLRNVALTMGARQNRKPFACWNAEKVLDPEQAGGASVTLGAITASALGIDCLVSTLPWAFNIDYSILPLSAIIEAQLFPAESMITASDPRSCRSRFFKKGAREVRFMYGVKSRGIKTPATGFPYGERGIYSLYTGDDLNGDYSLHAPQKQLTPLTVLEFPYSGPLYGPSSKFGASKHLSVKRIKRALHNAGFADFSNIPDSVYNLALERAVKNMQRHYGISQTGNYGQATWERIRTLPSANRIMDGPLWALRNA